jgi:hypothetical protein
MHQFGVMAKPIHLLVLLAGISTTISAQTGRTPADTIWKNKYYIGMVMLPGVGVQLSHPPGSLAISVPYTVTDASGVTSSYLFSSAPKKIYHFARPELGNFEIEYGRKRFYVVAGGSACMEGISVLGDRASVGAGLNWYPHDRRQSNREKGLFLFQTGVNVVWNLDDGGHRDAILGGVDNTNDTVRVLGITAGPTFTLPATRYSSAQTETSKHADIAYAQNEVAIMPMISIANHFLSSSHVSFRVDIGYSIPVKDDGFIYIEQDDGDLPGKGSVEQAGDAVPLGNPAVSAKYNGVPIRKAPYRLKGMFVAVSVWMTSNGGKRKGRH